MTQDDIPANRTTDHSASSHAPKLCTAKDFASKEPPPLPPSDFEQDYAPLDDMSAVNIVDATLKRPGRITYAITSSDGKRLRPALLLIIILCMAGHGLAMGSFSGGHQLWFVPLKLVAGLLVSAIICLPSLYILSSLSGAQQTLVEMWGILLHALALAALLMVGFTPIAWVFAQSTDAAAFMGTLHLVFWCASAFFAFKLLNTVLGYLNKGTHPTLRLWAVMFMMVVLQMTTTLRPFIGEYTTLQVDEKRFFAAHWLAAVKGSN